MVSKEVLNNPVKFNDAILDKPNKDYAQWILKMESWGGAIEIGIVSDALAVAIYVVDIDAVKIEKFNEDKFDNYILILFNGIHYDSLTMNEFKTVFNKNPYQYILFSTTTRVCSMLLPMASSNKIAFVTSGDGL
eukprot:Lithocolla_globosa_v1_NODE_12271_length_446_cov_7.445013.p1 type:complete len:134 gc:universal NODE_12271_length_446_cov_7.445013:409-8(-)